MLKTKQCRRCPKERSAAAQMCRVVDGPSTQHSPLLASVRKIQAKVNVRRVGGKHHTPPQTRWNIKMLRWSREWKKPLKYSPPKQLQGQEERVGGSRNERERGMRMVANGTETWGSDYDSMPWTSRWEKLRIPAKKAGSVWLEYSVGGHEQKQVRSLGMSSRCLDPAANPAGSSSNTTCSLPPPTPPEPTPPSVLHNVGAHPTFE